MVKIISRLCIVLGALIVASAAYLDYSGHLKFSVTEEKAQSVINEHLSTSPVRIVKMGVEVVPTEVGIDFLASDSTKAKIHVTYNASGYGFTGHGDVTAEAKIHYQTDGVFLRELQIIEHTLEFDDPEQVDNVKQAVKSLLNTLASKLADQRVQGSSDAVNTLYEHYRPKIKDLAAKTTIKMLEAKPIYSLQGKDLKFSLAAMSVKSINTDENSLHVTLSLTQLISTIALYIIGSVLAIVAAFGLVLSGRTNSILLSH